MMTRRGLISRHQYAIEPTEPAPTPSSPAAESSRSRSSSPAIPIIGTEHPSYGSAPETQLSFRQAERGEFRAESISRELQDDAERKTDTNQSRILRFLNCKYSPYLFLENSGSVARDHLALERTFLAYVRTSLAVAAAGVALVQLLSVSSSSNSSDRTKKNLLRFARPLGATLVVVSVLVLTIGFLRYFRIQANLISGNFPLARLATAIISSTIALLVAVIFGILVHTTQ